jgi:hypothetical protein
MITRTRRKFLRFDQPFLLRVIDAIIPAGTYAVDTDEELIEGLSYFAYLRTATWIHLPAVTANSSCSQMILVQPAEVKAGYEVAEDNV